jgi:FkbM family methyltransferase
MRVIEFIKVILRDARGIARVCGPAMALHWLFCIARSAPQCLAEKNLQPADRLMGRGPFRVRRGRARATLAGEQVFSGIREIWVRDVYLKNDFLRIEPGAVVLDLGANMGNFSHLALAHDADVSVVAVEPSRMLSETLRESARLNGWDQRVQVERAFIGTSTQVQERVGGGDPEYSGVPFVAEADFVERLRLQRIDLLKCDIEGSEFFLIEPESRLLGMARQLAIEIHPWGGNVAQFLARLKALGFVIGSIEYDAGGACIALARRV